jgi:hypothetical protein
VTFQSVAQFHLRLDDVVTQPNNASRTKRRDAPRTAKPFFRKQTFTLHEMKYRSGRGY